MIFRQLWLLLLCGLSFLLFAGASSFAQAAEAQERLEFALDGPDAHQSRTRIAIEEALLGLEVSQEEVERVPTVEDALQGEGGSATALARVHVNFRGDQLRLIIVDRSGKDFYVRTVPYNGEQAELAYEQVAQILRSTIVAMKERERLAKAASATPAAEKSAPPVPPQKTAPPQNSLGFMVGAAGALQLYSSELAFLPSVEGMFDFSWSTARQGGVLRFSSGYQWASFESSAVGIQLQQLPLSLQVGHLLKLGHWRLKSLWGGGVLLVNARPTSIQKDVIAGDDPRWVSGVFRISFQMERRFQDRWAAFVALNASAIPSQRRLVMEDGATTEVLLDPYPVQASLALGLAFGR